MIYLDHNGTTPIAHQAAEAMGPYIDEIFGNPSSAHEVGQRAKMGVEEARLAVSRLLGCKPGEVIFTSGGTESNNTVFKGIAHALRARGRHIVTTEVEHPSVVNPLLFLLEQGWDLTFVEVDGHGRVDPDDVVAALKPETVLVSVMHANNEVGTLQPIREIGEVLRSRGVVFHTDAAQSVAKIPTLVDDLSVDLLTVAGHKLYGPKGVGALYIREGTPFEPFVHGAGQEMGRRGGTENVILAVGLGAACGLASGGIDEEVARIRSLRDRLHGRLNEGLGEVDLNGHPGHRLPNTLNVSIPGVNGADLLASLPGICASTGAACHDRSIKVSPVLSAMGIGESRALGAVRLSLGRANDAAQIEEAADRIITQAKAMRGRGASPRRPK